MALTTLQKSEIVKKYQLNDKDTGSSEVQVALLTEEINLLNVHLKMHKHDFHSQRGLLAKVGHRRNLLKYLKKADPKSYEALIAKLGIRR